MRAQNSLEFLVILSIALLGLLIFVGISQSESLDVMGTRISANAQNAAMDVAIAAEQVYAQGAGAKKKITLMMPDGYESSHSSVGNKSVRIRAADTDYVRVVEFDVYGTLPQTSGRHEVWIVSEGDRVRIGNAMVAAGESISTVLGQDDTRTESLTIRNIWDSQITVGISQEWGYGAVTLGLSESSFVLPRGDSKTITLRFISNGNASGFYSGSLNISADDGSGNHESISVPLTAEVSDGEGTGEGPPLTVVPSTASLNMTRNSTSAFSFQVCTNSKTALSQVNFAPSTGQPGTWIGMTTPLSALATGECRPKTLNVSVPSNATVGEHTGFVFVTGDISGAEDALALSVLVGGSDNDSNAPSVNVSVFPNAKPIFVQNPVSVRAIASDAGSGDNIISLCRVQMDNNGTWYNMVASDGAYNEMNETAGYTFYAGYNLGTHSATVECTDSKNNSRNASMTFKVMKELLFVTANSTPTADESAWMNWLLLGLSNEGYSFSKDNATSSAFIAGSVNTSYYTTIVAERYVSGMNTRLNSFGTAGGSLIMVGHAAADAPLGLGLSSSAGSSSAETRVDVLTSAHYITANYSGIKTVLNSSTTFGLFWKDVPGTLLAKSMVSSPPHWHTLAASGRTYLWGPYSPANLNPTGINITSRTFDHAINASIIR